MMEDDALYGAVGMAHRLGVSIPDVMAMPITEYFLWQAYFQRTALEPAT